MTPTRDPAAPIERPPGPSVRVTWWYTWVSILIFVLVGNGFVIFWLAVLPSTRTALQAFAIALTVLATAAQVVFSRRLHAGLWSQSAPARAIVLLLAPAVLAAIVSLGAAQWRLTGAVPLAIALSLLMTDRPRPWCWPLIVGLAAVLILHHAAAGWIAEAAGDGPSVITAQALRPVIQVTGFFGVFSPVMILLTVWVWTVVRRLDDLRSTEADLAVARERLRFASDLHDIQGHHLQVIALKAELAERLLRRDPRAAAQQLRETRETARQALEETRGLVQDLRQVSLREELDNAADVLGAAGIDCQVQADDEPRSPDIRRTLGLVAREATTNILRHSSAASASYRLTRDGQQWRLRVRNDGVVPSPSGSGSGLDGLRERLSPLGGSLSSAADGETFTLEAVVPATAHQPEEEPAAVAPNTSIREEPRP